MQSSNSTCPITSRQRSLCLLLVASFLACLVVHPTLANSIEPVPDQAENICPILLGTTLPDLGLRTTEEEPFDMTASLSEKPAVLIFYRGGWCPYCTTHLGQLQTIESDLLELGFQLMAISADRPEIVENSAEKQKLGYRLLSDNDVEAAKALGIAFRVDDATVSKYKNEYSIDIEADSGHTHHMLPVPSVFVIDKEGLIRFSYVNPNYKVRIDPALLLEAAKSVAKESAR